MKGGLSYGGDGSSVGADACLSACLPACLRVCLNDVRSRARLRRTEHGRLALAVLAAVARYPPWLRYLRREVWECFLSDSFFPVYLPALPSWTVLLHAIGAAGHDRIDTLLGPSAPSPGVGGWVGGLSACMGIGVRVGGVRVLVCAYTDGN